MLFEMVQANFLSLRLTAGVVIKQYEILSSKPLGNGAYAAVYHAKHRKSGVNVALKCIPHSNPDPLSSVETEVEALTRTRGHPNVVSLYDVFQDDSFTYLVLEHCSNGTLHDFLQKNGPVPEDMAKKWFAQLVRAVSFCQDRGVINQDLKNENVLFDSNMNVKIVDFGLCVLTDGDASRAVTTRAGGSPVFAAPEVYGASLNGISFRPALAESWALGVILHSILTGALPFPVRHYQRMWMRYQPPTSLSTSCQDLLQYMLKHTPSVRLPVKRIQEHVWLREQTDDGCASCSDDEVANLDVDVCYNYEPRASLVRLAGLNDGVDMGHRCTCDDSVGKGGKVMVEVGHNC
eukprot:comp5493_c0_seq1/m.1429 comp5493_c0_seq1/g.1429  ORF comp5493_c0_seq1/g.1429 comp5493_c0_seq1/m.1429 type:complete len:348 (-) comp5493_c0_seq1:535-1578(-)